MSNCMCGYSDAIANIAQIEAYEIAKEVTVRFARDDYYDEETSHEEALQQEVEDRVGYLAARLANEIAEALEGELKAGGET